MHPLSPCAAAAALLACGVVAAQTPPSAGAPAGTLAPVTVTGNPLGSADVAVPVTVLEGAPLLLRRQPSLGETLSGTPGVAGSYFGPVSSRPIVRGLDGDRVRILENGGALLDVSSLSQDHAVSLDPIAIERIEVLRGPGALLYGGNAIGGVVNLVDNRIPRAPLEGVIGRADVGLATGNRERGGAVLVEGGNSRIGLHLDGFARSAGDTRVPVALACTRGGTTTTGRRLCNSDHGANGGAIGASLFFDRGYVGASTSESQLEYGSASEGDVRLDLHSRRRALEGEVRDLPGPVQSVKVQGSETVYRHVELNAGVPATRFDHRGRDVRVEARHAPWGALRGVVGLQLDQARLAAQGAESFLPPSRTGQQALFVLEEFATGWGQLSFGARRERVEVESQGSPTLARFVAARRSFSPSSLSAGAVWNAAPAWQFTGSLARSQRAPRDYELFADGPHAATGAYEVGNAAISQESATSVDLGAQWKSGPHRLKLTGFESRFRNYLALLATGRQRDTEGNGAATGATDCGDGTSVESGCTARLMPEFGFRGVQARLRGLEVEGTVRAIEGARPLDVELRGDVLRGRNLTLGQPLPRLSPWRVGSTLAWTAGPWSLRGGFDHWGRQDRVPASDRVVGGYTLWNAALTYAVKAGPARLQWYARLDNATNRAAYSATSLLTQSAPGRVPLPGRSLRVGVKADF